MLVYVDFIDMCVFVNYCTVNAIINALTASICNVYTLVTRHVPSDIYLYKHNFIVYDI